MVFLENAAEIGLADMDDIGKVPQRTQGCKVPLDVFEALLTEGMACAARRSTQGLWRRDLTEDEFQQLMTGLSLFGFSEIDQLLKVGADPGQVRECGLMLGMGTQWSEQGLGLGAAEIHKALDQRMCRKCTQLKLFMGAITEQ